MSMTITSTAFRNNGSIPARFTCAGSGISPQLHWSDVPPQTKSLVLIVDDPDAPDPANPQRTFVHWVLYNLPPGGDGLSEGVQPNTLPGRTVQGVNDYKRTGYGGPCPAIGKHRYFFKLYALDKELKPAKYVSKAQVEKEMRGHVIESAELVGTFEK